MRIRGHLKNNSVQHEKFINKVYRWVPGCRDVAPYGAKWNGISGCDKMKKKIYVLRKVMRGSTNLTIGIRKVI